MSKNLGNISYAPTDDESQFQKPYSESTAQKIDEEVRHIIAAAYQRTVKLLQTHKAQVQALATRLLEKETVNHDDLIELLGKRLFNDSYAEYLEKIRQAEGKGAAAHKQEETNNATEDSGAQPQPT